MKALLAAGVFVLTGLVGAWLFRFEVTPTSGVGALPSAYLLDRWTGNVFIVVGPTIRAVQPPLSE